MPAVGTPLVGHPAEDEPDPGRERHADHQSGIHESSASAELDEDVTVLDDDWIARHLDGGVVGVGASRDVPAPGVPGTEDDAALEIALAQRATAVDAAIVDRVERAVDVEEGEVLALGLDDPALPDRHVLRRRDPHAPLSHSRLLDSAPSSSASDFAPPETASQMIVDHAGGLHESVADRRAHEPEAPREEISAHGPRGIRLGRALPLPAPGVAHGPTVDEPPDVRVEAAVLALDRQECPCIGDR